MTVRSVLQQARATLRSISDAPKLDAERLLLHVLGRSENSWLYAHGSEELSEEQVREFARVLHGRMSGQPLAYVLGTWEFYGREFYVTEDVLVPRPATEDLIDCALEFLRSITLRNIVLADVGTGSGVIAVTLALETTSPALRKAPGYLSFVRRGTSPLEGEVGPPGDGPDEVKILATDISPEALEVARKNAKRWGVLDQIEFIQEDMAETLKRKNIDLIVSNPPYVPSRDVDKLPDPAIALDGGTNGQDYVQKIAGGGIPAIVETTNGTIRTFYLESLQP